MTTNERAEQWLAEPFDKDTQEQVRIMSETDPDGLKESFYKDLEFGTGGMRGIMGPGTNRINRYTLGKATQGLANYMKGFFDKDLSVAIAYDCRHNSKSFAGMVADVLSANGIRVYLFEDLRPTPELSFAVRHLGCDAGIVLTASHNPPEYNGYKVYWNDGGQIVPPHDTGIIDQVNSLAYDEVRFDADPDLITLIGSEIDQVFIDACVANGTFDVKERQGLNIVFTSLHGTSIQSIPDALEQAGFTNVHIVEEQRIPDGDFPTVESPNPEESAALKMALDLAEETNADIVIGTDPDSDRLGIAVRDMEGKMRILNGNQTMCLMTDYLLQQWQKLGKLNGRQFVGTTIVSTDLVRDIATSYGAETKIGLTGFKWIAKMIREAEGELDFVGGGEESFGYMVGDFVRDKDAVTATLLACELAADAKQNGSSTYRELLKLYLRHSYYREHLISLVRKGMDGAEQIARMMADLREKPVECIDGSDVVYVYDYKTSVRKDLKSGNEAPISIPGSNVLIFETEDGTRVAARPSGTEPKIKFYFSVRLPVDSLEDIPHVEQALEQKIDRIIAELNLG